MSYPQPSSAAAVINKQGSFRLLTPLVSDGDIYYSEVGCSAIALGPESDIAKVNIGYFDPSAQGNMGIATCTPQRAFVNQTFAFNDKASVYMPSKVPGRILFWPDELWNPSFNPFGLVDIINVNSFRVDYITPVLDVIQYFGPTPSLTPQRSDKTYSYERLPFNITGAADGNAIMVPFYGRKYASISFGNFTDASITFAVYGVNFGMSTPSVISTQKELLAPAAIAPAAFVPTTDIVRASADGTFDALAVLFYGYSTDPVVPTGPVNVRITVSDSEL